MTPTNCQICGWREHVTETDWEDGRLVRACGVCLDPPAVPDEWTYEPTSDVQLACIDRGRPTRAAIAAFIADTGEATAQDVLARFGIDHHTSKGYDTVTTFLYRMRRDGELVARKAGGAGGHQGSFIYSPGTPRQRVHLPQVPRHRVVSLARRGRDAGEIARILGMNIPSVMVALRTARRLGELPATGRVFTCRTCGGDGHNSRTCEMRRAA